MWELLDYFHKLDRDGRRRGERGNDRPPVQGLAITSALATEAGAQPVFNEMRGELWSSILHEPTWQYNFYINHSVLCDVEWKENDEKNI